MTTTKGYDALYYYLVRKKKVKFPMFLHEIECYTSTILSYLILFVFLLILLLELYYYLLAYFIILFHSFHLPNTGPSPSPPSQHVIYNYHYHCNIIGRIRTIFGKHVNCQLQLLGNDHILLLVTMIRKKKKKKKCLVTLTLPHT